MNEVGADVVLLQDIGKPTVDNAEEAATNIVGLAGGDDDQDNDQGQV